MDRKNVKSFNDCFRELVWCVNTIKKTVRYGEKDSMFIRRISKILRDISSFPKKWELCGTPVVVNDIEGIYIRISIARRHVSKDITETYYFEGTLLNPLDFIDLMETIEEWIAYTNYRYTLKDYAFDVDSKTLQSNLFRY